MHDLLEDAMTDVNGASLGILHAYKSFTDGVAAQSERTYGHGGKKRK